MQPPQVYGLRVWHRGARLLGAARLHPNGTASPLGDATPYNVASTAYILSGGDGYTQFAAAPFLYPSGATMDEMMMADLAAAAPNAVGGSGGGGDTQAWGGGSGRRARRAVSKAPAGGRASPVACGISRVDWEPDCSSSGGPDGQGGQLNVCAWGRG
jgi:hypothetical protein